ncbi:MAG: ABC transporter permease [Prevotellaceae bacterium]|jgi:putative ABC transport system permease protein|nr:ABC transporter permease [Prevotellaceae bacterium]
MFSLYIKQAWRQLGENRLLTFISIVGTALAIAMIMAMVLAQRVTVEPYAPESNRDRLLYVKWMSVKFSGGGNSNGPIGTRTIKEIFNQMQTPEIVGVYGVQTTSVLVAVPGGELTNVDCRAVDDKFFKAMDYTFVHGAPFNAGESEAGQSRVVVTETVARQLYGTTDVVGRQIEISLKEYTVVGVVKDVSKLTDVAYAQIWVPYNSTILIESDWASHVMGMFSVLLLARDKSDFPAIRAEFDQLCLKYNELLKSEEMDVFFRGQPDTKIVSNNRLGANYTPNMSRIYWQFAIVVALLLLVPAINLSGLTLSRMRKRYPEIGVRRAFGAKRSEMLAQILTESLLLTIIGGAVGLLLSYVGLFTLGTMLFGNLNNNTLSMAMLFDPMVFVIAFLFCLFLNLLSAGVPAWRAARLNIVHALNA